MGAETVTVRLFVSTQTYDIPCDPRQSAKWLLLQAKNIQKSNQSTQQHTARQQHPDQIQDELEVLYNRTRRIVIDLAAPIGDVIGPMDVVDARTLLQTPDTTANSAMFPWLRSYPGGLQMSDQNLNSANGLFFQQLYAYTLIGRRTPQLPSQRREKQKQEEFLDLLQAYVVGSFDDEPRIEVSFGNAAEYGPNQTRYPPVQASMPAIPPTVVVNAVGTQVQTQGRRASDRPASMGFFSTQEALPARRYTEVQHPRDLDAVADPANDHLTNRRSNLAINDATGTRTRVATHPVSPSTSLPPPIPNTARRSAGENPLDEMENVFDIVFKQQAIGMKLGSDESKMFAVVKECFEGSEAKRYPEIQNGVVILAVNGQEVSGLGLSRVLYRLREAPRPVVVRFGRISNSASSGNMGGDDHQARMGTWG